MRMAQAVWAGPWPAACTILSGTPLATDGSHRVNLTHRRRLFSLDAWQPRVFARAAVDALARGRQRRPVAGAAPTGLMKTETVKLL